MLRGGISNKTLVLVLVVILVTVGVVLFGGNIPFSGGFSVAPTGPVPDSDDDASARDSECAHLKRAGLMNFPQEVKKLMINVGSFVDPPISDDPDTFTIAVEAWYRTANKIPLHPRLFVISAAISDEEGFAFMNLYGKWAESSSLSSYNPKQPWSWNWTMAPDDGPPFVFVPLMSLRTLLSSIPDHIEITLLKTDIQGHDLRALRHAGDVLKRIKRIECEVYCNGFQTYDGVANDFKDNKKLMKSLGFKLVNNPCPEDFKGEGDAFWERKTRSSA